MAIPAGIDIETTNSDPDTGGILSIGIFIPQEHGEDLEWYATVAPPQGTEWVYEAMQVNGFSPDHVADFDSYFHLDLAICRWLDMHAFSTRRRLLPVGWNVGSFDMQYIRRYLPNLFKRCNYNSIDLNSIVSYLTLCGYNRNDIKARVKAEADRLLTAGDQTQVDRHNALYDAKVSMIELELLKQEVV